MHNLPINFVVEADRDAEVRISKKRAGKQLCNEQWSDADLPRHHFEKVNLSPMPGKELDDALARLARERLGRS